MKDRDKRNIPHYKVSPLESDREAVLKVLESGFWAQGEECVHLEKEISEYLSLRNAAAVSSGTMALVLVLKSLGVKKGDEVIIPSYTCSALWHAVKFQDAEPVFVDCDRNTGNLSVSEVKRKVNKKTAAIIFPHMFGIPGEITELMNSGIPVIEDIAQSIGAEIQGKKTGSFGTAAVLSFFATKPVGSGEGGAVASNDSGLIEKIKGLREYDEKDSLILRYNAKISDFHAALARSRLKKLKTLTEHRKKIYDHYIENLHDLPLKFPKLPKEIKPNYYRCIGVLDDDILNDFILSLAENGITVRKPVYKPLHLYDSGNSLPNSEYLWSHSFSLPCYPGLLPDEQNKVIEAVKCFFRS